MDRHDVSESITAEKIAELHQEDLKVQRQFDCRGLTYWFDDKRKTAFCLIEAPDKNAIVNMHNKAHGDVPHSIIEVEASIVESFLGRIEMVDVYDDEEVVNVEFDFVNAVSLIEGNLPGWNGRSDLTLDEYRTLIEVAKMVQKERHFLHMCENHQLEE